MKLNHNYKIFFIGFREFLLPTVLRYDFFDKNFWFKNVNFLLFSSNKIKDCLTCLTISEAIFPWSLVICHKEYVYKIKIQLFFIQIGVKLYVQRPNLGIQISDPWSRSQIQWSNPSTIGEGSRLANFRKDSLMSQS